MILVTGAAGHIGNALVRLLSSKGEKIKALVLPGENTQSIENLGIEFVEGDILNSERLYTVLDGVTDVFHLAGVISIMPGKHEHLERVNVQGTENILTAAVKAGIRRLVYTSSIHAIKRVPQGKIIDENLPFDAQNPYGAYDRSKAKASILVQKAVSMGVDAVIICPTGVIGPYDYRGSEIGQVIVDTIKEKPQFYIEGAYDFVDVRDVADGMVKAWQKGRSGESYILSGEKISIIEIIRKVQLFSGLHLPVLRIPTPLAKFTSHLAPLYYRITHTKPRFTPYSIEVLQSNCEISHEKATQELGYHPRQLSESIRDTVEWFLENRMRFSSKYT